MRRLAFAAALLAAWALAPTSAPAASAPGPVAAGQSPTSAALSAERPRTIDRGYGAGLGIMGEVWRVPMQQREIALTFDDGPYPFYTPLLLHELERSHAVGTFFVVGRSAQEFPELVREIVEDGNEIGNHTFNHYKLTKLTQAQIADQIAQDGALLEPFARHPITLFRPPHGRYDHQVVAIAHAMGYETIFWNDSPEDTKPILPSLVVSRVVSQATPGGIVLLHSGQYKTIEALPVIIDQLRREGYRFVTVSQLLADGGVQPR